MLYLKLKPTEPLQIQSKPIDLPTIRSMEPIWRNEAKANFPADEWSQHDHFANKERQWFSLQGYSDQKAIKAIDENIRNERVPKVKQLRASSFPCMPRPFYD